MDGASQEDDESCAPSVANTRSKRLVPHSPHPRIGETAPPILAMAGKGACTCIAIESPIDCQCHAKKSGERRGSLFLAMPCSESFRLEHGLCSSWKQTYFESVLYSFVYDILV